MRSRAVIAAAVAALLPACGGGADEQEDGNGATTVIEKPMPLTQAEMKVIDGTREEVDSYCLKVADAVARGRVPRQADFQRVVAALDQLAALARERPEATGPDGTSPSLALSDLAEFLEGSNCDSRLVTRIDQALGTIP